MMLLMNELRYALRQPLVWLCMLIPVLFSLLLSSGLGATQVDQSKQLTLNLIVLHMMVLPVLVAVLSPVFYLRDQQAAMHELIAVTPVSQFKRGLVRILAMCGLILSVMSVCSFAVLGLYNEQLGFDPRFTATTASFIGLLSVPNILLLSVLGYVVCVRSVNSLLNYVVLGIVLMGYLMLASVTGNPVLAGSNILNDSFYQLFIWLDPFAYTAVIKHFSASAEQLNVALMINRVVVVLVSGLIAYLALQFNGQKTRIKHRRDEAQTAGVVIQLQCQYQSVALHGSSLAAFLTLLRTSIHAVLANKLILGIVLLWGGMVWHTVASSTGYIEPMSTLRYTSQDALNQFAFDMLPLLGTCFVVLCSWQVVFLAQNSQIAQLLAATSLKTDQLVLAHLMTICVLVLLFLGSAALGSSVAQWFSGSVYDGLAYAKTLSLVGLPLLIFAGICMGICHFCRSQVTAGLIMSMIVVVKFTPVMTYLGLTHTFWSIAWTPLQAPDAFWGYRASMSSYWPYLQVWLCACISVIATAMTLSHRGTGLNRAKMKPVHGLLIVPWFITVAAFINLHLQLVAEKPLTNSHKREAFKARYEMQFSDWRHRAQPSIRHLDAKVDFYPIKQRAEFKLTYTLVNHHTVAIKQVLVGRAGFYHWADVSLNGASMVTFDPTLNQAVFEFEQPMQPGETRTLTSDLNYQQPVVWPSPSHQFVTPELSYIRSVPFIPTVGYQENYQLTDAQLRAKYQLAPLSQRAPSEIFADQETSAPRSDRYDWMTISSTISTAQGYVALAQGRRVAMRTNNGRDIYQFETSRPIRAIASWLTMPVAAKTKQQHGVTLQVFSAHKNQAVQLNLTAMADTLDWFNEHISAYKGEQLSLISVPRIGMTGYALPQLILINEDVGFRATPSDDAGFDQRYRRAVHETAHQWFGHDIGNGVSEDSAFLVESMAKYVELVMLDQHYGPSAVAALVAYETKRYQQLSAMDLRKGVALVDATQSHDLYSRATLVFAELRETIGDDVIIEALQTLWQRHGYPQRPANSMDFVRYLKLAADPSHHALIERLFLQPPIKE